MRHHMTRPSTTPLAPLQAVPQQHALGCSVACVAARCGLTYREALALFEHPEQAWTRGYDCSEIVAALARAGLHYAFDRIDPDSGHDLLSTPGTIVFIEPGPAYPAGHYLLRTERGWMNSWSNFPNMIPVESSFVPELPGRPAYWLRERAITP
jgi:hypothetical protein